jgi:hypothetical protein
MGMRKSMDGGINKALKACMVLAVTAQSLGSSHQALSNEIDDTLNNARKWGHQFRKDMSKSQHDRLSFLAWHINVMAWQGPEDGGPNSGYDPVCKCTLGGETAKEVPITANPRDYSR